MYKKCKIVTKPTKSCSELYFIPKLDKVVSTTSSLDLGNISLDKAFYINIYIVAYDETIKFGDFFFKDDDEFIRVNFSYDFKLKNYGKIIATNDKNSNLPRLSSDFLKFYEDKNGKVDEVLVNYSEVSEPEIYEFDNKQYLSIKLQKENFNINELPIQAIKDCLKYCENHQIYDKLLRNNRLCFFRFKNVPIYLDIKNHKARRIIASTDKELKLPKPSKNFIKKYIQKEGKIDFVNVQYTSFNYLDNKLFYLKTRKDNTIVTKHFQEENDNLIEHFEKDISNKENIIKIKEFNASFIEDILELSSKSYNLGFVNGKNSNSFPQVEKEFNEWFRKKYFSNVKINFENISENFLSRYISYIKGNDEVICYNGTTGKFVEFSDSNRLKIDTSIGILEIHTLDIKYIIYK